MRAHSRTAQAVEDISRWLHEDAFGRAVIKRGDGKVAPVRRADAVGVLLQRETREGDGLKLGAERRRSLRGFLQSSLFGCCAVCFPLLPTVNYREFLERLLCA